MDHPERVPVHLRARDGQGLEAVDPPPRQEHEAPADQGDPHDAPAHLRLRRLQDIVSGGESQTIRLSSMLCYISVYAMLHHASASVAWQLPRICRTVDFVILCRSLVMAFKAHFELGEHYKLLVWNPISILVKLKEKAALKNISQNTPSFSHFIAMASRACPAPSCPPSSPSPGCLRSARDSRAAAPPSTTRRRAWCAPRCRRARRARP